MWLCKYASDAPLLNLHEWYLSILRVLVYIFMFAFRLFRAVCTFSTLQVSMRNSVASVRFQVWEWIQKKNEVLTHLQCSRLNKWNSATCALKLVKWLEANGHDGNSHACTKHGVDYWSGGGIQENLSKVWYADSGRQIPIPVGRAKLAKAKPATKCGWNECWSTVHETKGNENINCSKISRQTSGPV